MNLRLTQAQRPLFLRLRYGICAGRETFFVALGATRMKKILIVAATAGLMSLAACNGGTTNTTAENVAAAEEANAATYDSLADNATNEATEAVFENAEAAAENRADVAEANAH
jgi:hypothetical protein